jgi:hypothetical protein
MNVDIAELFSLLDQWRHLPAYQLERRADIFFALYLPELLIDRLEIEIDGEVVPEFPVNKSVLSADIDANRSVKVDYAAFAADRSQCVFVELKTDHRVIDFEEVAGWLEGRGALAETFAESLLRWQAAAGSRRGAE